MNAKIVDVVFDGQCRFCIRSLNLLRVFDRKGTWRFNDANDHSLMATQFPQLLGADLQDAMYVVVDGEQPYRGYYAFRRLIKSKFPLNALLPLMYFPGVSRIGEAVYAAVARNRHKFGCASGLCELNNGDKEKLLNRHEASG